MFRGSITREEINSKYEKYDSICQRFRNLSSLDLDQVAKLEKDFIEYTEYYQETLREHGIFVIQKPNPLFSRNFEMLQKREEELYAETNPEAKIYRDNKLIFQDDEEINGYKLWKLKGEPILTFDYFKDICDEWDKEDMSEQEFEEWLDKNLCTDWAKMDRNGKSFAGFWRYPKESDEYANAYHLTLEDNIQGLRELPYPRNVIVMTIELGCSNRYECVRYSNFICEWVKRKKEIVF